MNESGINPTGHNVVVEVDKIEEKTAGGIIMPEAHLNRENLGSQEGVLVATSPTAFDYIDWPEGSNPPKPGDRVLFAKFAGIDMERAGKTFRVCEDKEILATLDA